MNRHATKPCELETRTYRLGRDRIWYLQFIIEAYDGLAMVSTVDPRQGVVHVRFPSSRSDEATQLLAALSREFCLEELSAGEGDGLPLRDSASQAGSPA